MITHIHFAMIVHTVVLWIFNRKRFKDRGMKEKHRIIKCMNNGEIWYKVQTHYLFFWWTYGFFMFDIIFRTEKEAAKTIENLKEVKQSKQINP